MKKTIQTKRNKPSGSNYRVLYAKTGRKRRLRAATAAMVDPHVDLDSEVPNMRIGRALLVILILHIVAIAAVYIHSHTVGSDPDSGANSKVPMAAASGAATAPEPEEAPAPEPDPEPVAPVLPEVNPDSRRHYVETGDTYHRIATRSNVSERSLRALNGNRPLRPGVVLDLPSKLSSRPVLVANTPPPKPALAVLDGDRNLKSKSSFRAKKKDSGPDVSNAPKAIVVKPTVKRPATPAVNDSGKRYTIKSGDTIWRISHRYKVSRESLLKINGIKDANKLYIGRTIKIPSK